MTTDNPIDITLTLKKWIEVVSTKNSLLSAPGSLLWQEGLDRLNALSARTFFKNSADCTAEEIDGLAWLEALRAEGAVDDRSFLVTSDLVLKSCSPLYRSIQSEANGLSYQFTDDEVGNFSPWNDCVVLGHSFHRRHVGKVFVPFYTYNHENAHHVLFGRYYSNLELNDRDLARLLILMEWFCISMDLILAYDLHRAKMKESMIELNVIPNHNANSEKSIFHQNCRTCDGVDRFAGHLRKAFVTGVVDIYSESLLSAATIHDHRKISSGWLLHLCRQQKSRANREQSRALLTLLESASLTSIVQALTGDIYE